jgi:hypothetical protein
MPEPASAITFKTGVMYYNEALGRSVIVPAGEPSPWTDITDVPARLQNLIGTPSNEPPPDTPNQRWVPKSMLEAEREMIDRLNNDDDLDPAVRDALAERDVESQRIAAERNKTYAEIAARDDMDRDRLMKELEEEKRTI